MTKKQFKHESDGYIPLMNSGEIHIRPEWVPKDEVLIDYKNPLSKKHEIRQKFVKINSLSKEEFIKYQKDGRIPKDYDIKDWLDE